MKYLALTAALALAIPLAPPTARAAQAGPDQAGPDQAGADQARGAVLSDQDHTTLRSVEAYLNGLRTLKSRFVQTAPDGATSSGTLWLSRPGQMRFEYAPPSPLLLVAGHGVVTVRDNKADQTSNMKLSQTPLGLLLRDQVTLGGDVTVTAFEHAPAELQITLVKTAAPGDGTLTLHLLPEPLALSGWDVVDGEGRETHIRLSGVVTGGTFAPDLFTYTDPNNP
jgi:outer membrane lipoprotein-sorting protein